MTQGSYGTGSIEVSEIIGRQCNNPLGPGVLRELVAEAKLDQTSKVLDVGSGRGVMALELHQLSGCSVTGVELSKAMWSKAVEAASGLNDIVRFVQGDALQFLNNPSLFHAATCFDALAYFKQRQLLLGKIAAALVERGWFLFTDYFIRGNVTPEAARLVDSWSIEIPLPFSQVQSSLESAGFEFHFLRDTTREYETHWTEMRRRTLDRRAIIVQRCGQAAFDSYLAAVESILAGVAAGGFGHLHALVRKR